MSVTAVVGGQYGSEGKGLVVGHLAKDYDVHVRVGAANAGHTVYTAFHPDEVGEGCYEKHVMQQLPCAAYANPDARLVLGAGAMISMEILCEEIALNARWRVDKGLEPARIYVDRRAHVVTPEHVEAEQRSTLAERIGSTSTIAKEGIGAAQAARVMREGYLQASEASWHPLGEALRRHGLGGATADRGAPRLQFDDTVALLHEAMAFDNAILLEGTQGTGLSNITGQYPYVTSRCTTAAGLIADCGIAPNALDQVIMVCRSFPIRVAGNSGPFWPDSREITWDEVGIDPETERTTVTKKIRRVATLSLEQLRYAAMLNGATEVALTFADYLNAAVRDATSYDDWDYVAPVVERIEHATGVPVAYVGTGPQSLVERDSALCDTI